MKPKFKDLIGPKKCPTGIEGLKHITMGGIPENRTTMIVGSSGTGKTVLVSELIYRSINQFDRHAVFVTFE